MMKRCFLYVAVGVFLICSGCSPALNNTVTQTSTIDALLAGLYDGHMTCRKLLDYGNFGIGTFDRLEGEMIIADGNIYQVKADGKVYTPRRDMKTPFASICRFSADKTISLRNGFDFNSLEKMINAAVPNQNLFCAVKIRGHFARMKTRSVPAQKKPYPPLAEVTKHQPEFDMENVSGTIVGFRCPPYVKGVNVPGYHLHFISSDFDRGGHILGFEMTGGTCEIDLCNRFFLILPEDQQAFQHVDLSKDRSKELEEVEK